MCFDHHKVTGFAANFIFFTVDQSRTRNRCWSNWDSNPDTNYLALNVESTSDACLWRTLVSIPFEIYPPEVCWVCGANLLGWRNLILCGQFRAPEIQRNPGGVNVQSKSDVLSKTQPTAFDWICQCKIIRVRVRFRDHSNFTGFAVQFRMCFGHRDLATFKKC